MIKYKIDVMAALKSVGLSSYKMRKEKIFGEATMTVFRNQEPFNFDNLDKLCKLLDCQPGDILEYVSDSFEATKQPTLEEIHTIAAFEGDSIVTKTKKGDVDEAIRKIKEKQK